MSIKSPNPQDVVYLSCRQRAALRLRAMGCKHVTIRYLTGYDLSSISRLCTSNAGKMYIECITQEVSVYSLCPRCGMPVQPPSKPRRRKKRKKTGL